MKTVQTQTMDEVLNECDFLCLRGLAPGVIPVLAELLRRGQTIDQIMDRVNNFEVKVSPTLLESVRGALNHMIDTKYAYATENPVAQAHEAHGTHSTSGVTA